MLKRSEMYLRDDCFEFRVCTYIRTFVYSADGFKRLRLEKFTRRRGWRGWMRARGGGIVYDEPRDI